MHEVQLKRKDDSVNLLVDPIWNQAAPILKTAYIMHGAEAVVTSGADGDHSKKTAHTSGRALDLRIFTIPQKERRVFCSRLAQALVACLGPYFWVVLETTPEHIHVEYAPPGTNPKIKNLRAGIHFYVEGE